MTTLAASLLAKVTLIALLALAGTRLARRTRAAVRHVMLAGAFAALLVLPAASLLAPSIRVALPIAVAERLAPRGVVPPADAAATALHRDIESLRAPAHPPAPSSSSWPALAGGIWASGAMLFLFPVIAGLFQVRALRRSGLPWPHGQAILEGLARDAAIARPIELLRHESLPGPMTCGILRPVVILPEDAVRWPDNAVRRAIVHELEHVRRGDWLTLCVARVVCAAYWLHPLVWIASRQLSLEAERACDDAVVRRADATAYADQLVALAAHLSGVARSPLLAMANRHDLATRVFAVLDSGQPRGRAGARWLTLGWAVTALLVTVISPLRVVVTTRGQTPAASPAAQTFAVASIKPCAAETVPSGPGSRGRGGGAGNVTASPGSLHVDCTTLHNLVDKAYGFFGEPLLNESGPPREDTPRVKGGPAWVRSEKFTIDAKADGVADRATMMGPMMRALLEERFQVKMHREVEDIPAYGLTVAKGGLKITPIGAAGCLPYDPDNPPPPSAEPGQPRPGTPVCGSVMRGQSNGMRTVDLGGMELEILMVVLNLDRRVIDRTGITDRFNIHFEYPDEPEGDRSDPSGPTVFRALEQQLGLKLEPIKAPHGFIVIDKVVHP